MPRTLKNNRLISEQLVRKAVLQLTPYQAGKPIAELARESGRTDIDKLASNENPLGPSPKAVEAVQRALSAMHLYPDANGYLLKKRLAQKFGLRPENFTLGNGSSDILSFVLWAFANQGDEVLTSETTFVMYPILAKVAHAKLVEVPLKNWCFDLDAMAKRMGPKTKVVFLCNPNNPTGTIIRQKAFDAFMQRVPAHTLVVVDEAYVEFVEDPLFPDAIEALRGGKNLVILRTFSKIVGLAGLRIGYGISSPEVADWLNRVRPPFNTSSLAQAGALAALDDEQHIRRTKQIVNEGKRFLTEQLQALGLEVIPSWTNYMVVRVQESADIVFRKLLETGVIIRSMASYGLPEYIRVSIGTMKQNKRFLQELKNILKRG